MSEKDRLDAISRIPASRRSREERRFVEAYVLREVKIIMRFWCKENHGHTRDEYEAKYKESFSAVSRKYVKGLPAVLDSVGYFRAVRR